MEQCRGDQFCPNRPRAGYDLCRLCIRRRTHARVENRMYREHMRFHARKPREAWGVTLPRQYCKGKVKFDKKGAKTAMNARLKDGAPPLRIYPCPDCGGWHLTHKTKKI